MEIDFVSKLVQDYLDKKLFPDARELQNVYFKYENQNLEIYSLLESYDGKPVNFPIAKAKRVKSKGVWKVYCMGQSMKWELYTVHPEVKDIYAFLKLIDEDNHSAFWG